MFSSLIAARAAQPVPEAFNPEEAALAQLDYTRSEQQFMREDEQLQRIDALVSALRVHGSTPALMAFANADGSLTAVAGAAPVAALESMSDEARAEDASGVIAALEAISERLRSARNAPGAAVDRLGKMVLNARQKRYESKQRAALVEEHTSAFKRAGIDKDGNLKKGAEIGKRAEFAHKFERSPSLTEKLRSPKGMAAAGGVAAAIALAAAGTIYIARRRAGRVAGTPHDVEHCVAVAHHALEQLNKLSMIAIPTDEAGVAHFDEQLHALTDLGGAGPKPTSVEFDKSGWTVESFKAAAKHAEELNHAHAEACAKLEHFKLSDEHHSECAHRVLAAIHAAESHADAHIRCIDRIIAGVSKHFTHDHAEGESGE